MQNEGGNSQNQKVGSEKEEYDPNDRLSDCDPAEGGEDAA